MVDLSCGGFVVLDSEINIQRTDDHNSIIFHNSNEVLEYFQYLERNYASNIYGGDCGPFDLLILSLNSSMHHSFMTNMSLLTCFQVMMDTSIVEGLQFEDIHKTCVAFTRTIAFFNVCVTLYFFGTVLCVFLWTVSSIPMTQ